MPHTDPFRAIADPNRRRALDLLNDKPLSVNELVRLMELSQPATSQILNVLKSAGLVDHRRDGRRMIYSVNKADLKIISNWVTKYNTQDEAVIEANPSSNQSPQLPH